MEKCPSRAVSGPPHSGDTHTMGLYPQAPFLTPHFSPPSPLPGPTFVLQAAVGLVAAVLAVVEAVADEAQADAKPSVTQMLVPGAALCGVPGRRAGGRALRTPCPKSPAPGKVLGVLTLIGGHGTVAGAEAGCAHAAVGDEGDAQEVGVGVEGGGHHVAAEPGGTIPKRPLSPPPQKLGCRILPGSYLAVPPRAGAGSAAPSPCSS